MATTDEGQLAAMFKALGDPTRLRIYTFLRDCCGPVAVDESGDVRTVNGPTVGAVCCHLTGTETVTSTLSHHIKELRLAGLITVERQGRHMICGINPVALTALTSYLTDEARNTSPDGLCCE